MEMFACRGSAPPLRSARALRSSHPTHLHGGFMDIVFITLTLGVFIVFAAFGLGLEKL